VQGHQRICHNTGPEAWALQNHRRGVPQLAHKPCHDNGGEIRLSDLYLQPACWTPVCKPCTLLCCAAIEMLAVGDLSPGDLLGEDSLELVPLATVTNNNSGSSRTRARSPLGRSSITHHHHHHNYDLVTPLASRPVSAGSRPSSGAHTRQLHLHHLSQAAPQSGPHQSPVPALTGLALLTAASEASSQQASLHASQGPITGGRSSSPSGDGPRTTYRPSSAREGPVTSSSGPTWVPTSSASARRPHSSPPRRMPASLPANTGNGGGVQQPSGGSIGSRPSSATGNSNATVSLRSQSQSRGRPASDPPLWLQQQLGMPQYPDKDRIRGTTAGASLHRGLVPASTSSSNTKHWPSASNSSSPGIMSTSAGQIMNVTSQAPGAVSTSPSPRPASASGTPAPHHQPFQPKIHTYRPASAGRGRPASSDGAGNRLFQPTIAFLGKCHSQPSSLRPHPTHSAGGALAGGEDVGKVPSSGSSQPSRTPVVVQLLPKHKDGVVVSNQDPTPITVWQ
jgi:hypothetical protein